MQLYNFMFLDNTRTKNLQNGPLGSPKYFLLLSCQGDWIWGRCILQWSRWSRYARVFFHQGPSQDQLTRHGWVTHDQECHPSQPYKGSSLGVWATGSQTGHSMAVWAGRVQQQTSVRAQLWQMVSGRPHPHLWKRKWGPELSFQKSMQLSRCQAAESAKDLHHPWAAVKVAIARYVSRWKTYWGW